MGMYNTVRGFMPRRAQQPAQNQPPSTQAGTGVSQQQQGQIAAMNAPQQPMQAPALPQGPMAMPRPQTPVASLQNAGMAGTNSSRVAGIMNSQPAPAAQAPGLPPGIDLNDPKNAALAGYMAQ